MKKLGKYAINQIHMFSETFLNAQHCMCSLHGS